MNNAMSALSQLYDLMCDMKTYADKHEWEQVDICDRQRKSLLDKLSQHTSPLSPAHRETLQQILQLDAEILDLATAERQRAACSVQQLTQQQSGARLYQQNQLAE